MCTCSSLNSFFGLLVLLALNSCKKSGSPNNNPSPSYIPAVTPIGTPVGNPVSKTIGSAGGSLASPDGKIELNISAGALSSNTTISIQAVTNEAPGGIGLSYHLTPDGIKFAKPVTLTYHYTDQEINGTLPYLLYVAYQDSLLQWKADFKKRNVDTIAKTVSLGISHFSDWSVGARIYIIALREELHKDEQTILRAVIQSPPTKSASGSDDDLPPLPPTKILGMEDASNWKVNGHTTTNQDGTITGNGGEVNYTAPSTIDKRRTVQISVDVRPVSELFNNGNQLPSGSKLILFKNLTLLPDVYNFHLHVEYNKTFLGAINSLYIDSATMDLTVQGTNVSVTNIKNYPLSIAPNPVPMSGCTMTYLPGPNGVINIQGASGYVGSDPNKGMVLLVNFSQSGTYEPGFDFSCSPASGLSQHVDPKSISGFLAGATFLLDNTPQTIEETSNNGQEKNIYKLIPR